MFFKALGDLNGFFAGSFLLFFVIKGRDEVDLYYRSRVGADFTEAEEVDSGIPVL